MIVTTIGGTLERIATDTGEVRARRSGQLVGKLPYIAPINSDWDVMASVDEADGRGAVLELDTLAPIRPIPPCTSPVAFSPDGGLLVLQGTVVCAPGASGVADPPTGAELRNRVIDVASGDERLDLGTGQVLDAAFNPAGPFPAGRFVAVNIDGLRIDVYEVAERRLVASLAVDDGLWKLTFDPTGQWLIGATGAGRVLVFDFADMVTETSPDESIVLDLVAHEGGVPRPRGQHQRPAGHD